MEKWVGKVAIVTGASSGIGKDIAIKLAHCGLKVIGCGRNFDRLVQVKDEISKDAKGEFIPFKCDVSKEEDVLNMFRFVKSNYKELSILVNNAGFALEGSIITGQTENWKSMLDTNVVGLCMCTREAFTMMREKVTTQRSSNEVPGHIINVGSLGGHIVFPYSFFHFYSATKFAVTAITECIRQELREAKSRIKVTQISPGAVDTEFGQRSGFVTNDFKIEVPGEFLKSSDIGDAIVHALSTEPRSAVHDMIIWPTDF